MEGVERERQKEGYSLSSDESEREEGGGILKRIPGPKRKSERKTGMKGGGPQTGK